MPRVNRTRFAILGMLMSGPRSGYDLKQDFEEQISHFWNESLGQIYPALHRLHDEGLVSVSIRRRKGRPERKVYRITKRGEAAFRAWLAQPAGPNHLRNELLLKIFFGPQMDPADALAHIERFEAEQRELRALYRFFEDDIERRPATPERKLYWRIALASGRHVTNARLAWCREAAAAVRDFAASSGRSRASA